MISKYLLLADDDEKNLHLQKAALHYIYEGEILLAQSRDQTLAIIAERGSPELICIELCLLTQNESELHRFITMSEAPIPIIIFTDYIENSIIPPQFTTKPFVLERPICNETLIQVVKGIISTQSASPGFVPIRVDTILENDLVHFDLYLKLSGTNFVKILNEEDGFSKNDAKKLVAKGIEEVHIKASDSHAFIRSWEKKINTAAVTKAISLVERNFFELEKLEQLESVSKSFGWDKNVTVEAEKTIHEAITILTKESNLNESLKERLNTPLSAYSMHVGMLSYLTCCLSAHIGWSKESQIKLAIASILHDLALDKKFYVNTHEWDKRAANSKDKDPETVKYRFHPIKASKLAEALSALPPDVCQIILQHHEVKDGSGFPRGLDSSRISQLSSFFIMVEDLTHYITREQDLTANIREYLRWGNMFYDRDHFKKIFELIKDRMPEKIS